MSIMEKIYEAYIAGELNIKPQSAKSSVREKILELEKQYKTIHEQAEKFESAIFDILDMNGKSMFFEGFRAASQLSEEISAKA